MRSMGFDRLTKRRYRHAHVHRITAGNLKYSLFCRPQPGDGRAADSFDSDCLQRLQQMGGAECGAGTCSKRNMPVPRGMGVPVIMLSLTPHTSSHRLQITVSVTSVQFSRRDALYRHRKRKGPPNNGANLCAAPSKRMSTVFSNDANMSTLSLSFAIPKRVIPKTCMQR